MTSTTPATAEKAVASTVYVTLFTDPLCCWSYAMQQGIDAVMEEFKHAVEWRICMAGMLPDWKKFSDSVNNISRPSHMGPMWMHASQSLGISIDASLWVRDPPVSSYPACLAYYAASMQHSDYGWLYLKLLWNSCMNDGRNISDRKVLTTIAGRLQQISPGFKADIFNTQLESRRCRQLFSEDLTTLMKYRINRLPSIVIKGKSESLLLTGYRPDDLLRKSLSDMLGQR